MTQEGTLLKPRPEPEGQGIWQCKYKTRSRDQMPQAVSQEKGANSSCLNLYSSDDSKT